MCNGDRLEHELLTGPEPELESSLPERGSGDGSGAFATVLWRLRLIWLPGVICSFAMGVVGTHTIENLHGIGS
jgi:hypothetical protein